MTPPKDQPRSPRAPTGGELPGPPSPLGFQPQNNWARSQSEGVRVPMAYPCDGCNRPRQLDANGFCPSCAAAASESLTGPVDPPDPQPEID